MQKRPGYCNHLNIFWKNNRMLHINITDLEIQAIHNAENHLAAFQGPPGLNHPVNVNGLGLPNQAGEYHFGVNQRAELLRLLNAYYEVLDLDIMVVHNDNPNLLADYRQKQETVAGLVDKLEAAQEDVPNNVNMAQGGRRRKHKSRKARKSRKTRKSKKSRRTRH